MCLFVETETEGEEGDTEGKTVTCKSLLHRSP